MSSKSDDIKIETDQQITALIFSVDNDLLFSAGDDVRVWDVQGGKQIAKMKTKWVYCLAVSMDGRYVAAGTLDGAIVWDATTCERVLGPVSSFIVGVDFSADSHRLVAGSWDDYTATGVWDVATGEEVFTLDRDYAVKATKYSLQGDKIATANTECVQVWDSDDGNLLVKIGVKIAPLFGNSALIQFSDDTLLAACTHEIVELDPITGSTISSWPTPHASNYLCFARPQHGEFLVLASDEGEITICSKLSRDQSPNHRQLVTRPKREKYPITISQDDQLLAIGVPGERIVLSRLSDSSSTLQELEFGVDDEILESWRDDRLTHAQVLLTDAKSHHGLACRALIQARLGQWYIAVTDAKKSIKSQPSVFGYISLCVALVGGGNKKVGMRACDMAFRYCQPTQTTILLLIKAIVIFFIGEHVDAISRVDDLIEAVGFNSSLHGVQAYMHLLQGSEYMEKGDYVDAIHSFGRARIRMRTRKVEPPLVVLLIFGWSFDGLWFRIRQNLCEALYAGDRIKEAARTVLHIVDDSSSVIEWMVDFMQRCLNSCKWSSDAEGRALLLRKWAKFKLATSTWRDTLAISVKFICPKYVICQVMCESLEAIRHISDAVACLQHMKKELGQEMDGEQLRWMVDFESRCLEELKELGKIAMDTDRYDEAISHYTVALSLNPTSPQAFLVERSRAYVTCKLWEDALNDAYKIVELDPSSPLGYERQHAALYVARRFEKAIIAYQTMLSKMEESSDPGIRKRSRGYVTPDRTKEEIRGVVRRTIGELPPELIHTSSGRLFNKSAQAIAFESEPIFLELIASMTTAIDFTRIEREVARFYRYATLSHKWEHDEPLYEKVVQVAVYELEESPTHTKLQTFCKIAQESGYYFAWSDTCCIDKRNNSILQEALISMFKWYEGSDLTVVFLLDVSGSSNWEALIRSIWNTRGWTLQEYLASKAVRFYTQEWKPFMDLTIHNHKESLEVISTMEKATGVSSEVLMALRPGLDDIREKLRLASTRHMGRIEDEAYSLLGIFSVSLQVAYGEGNKALGRLLAQLLASSGDTSILAWSGKPGNFNSCLPDRICVFSETPESYIPSASSPGQEVIRNESRSSSTNIKAVTELYQRLKDLPVPSFSGQRMRLPCLSFKLGAVLTSRNESGRYFQAQTAVLGIVMIKTEDDLSRLGSLYLIHPWIDFLLDRQPVSAGYMMETKTEENTSNDASPMLQDSEWRSSPTPFDTTPQVSPSRTALLANRLRRPFGIQHTRSGQEKPALRPPSTIATIDVQERALDFVGRLGQPFGALLLTPTRRNADEYRRVATDCLITVRVQGVTPIVLNHLARSVRILDVL